MKKILKITMILMIIIFGFQFQINKCYAQETLGMQVQKIKFSDEDINYWEPDKQQQETELDNKAKTILGYIRNIGIIISVIALMFIGIKTMVGSVEEKSHYKEALPAYVLGVIMVIAVTVLPSIIFDMVTNIKS